MRTREQAFKAYYSSMTDLDLLAIAKNRDSFMQLAQAVLAEELRRRRMAVPAVPPAGGNETPTFFTRLWRAIRPESAPCARASEQSGGPVCRIASGYIADQVPGAQKPHRGDGHIGATEDQVSMVAALPERINSKGTKVEDIAGTGEHDSLGG